MNKEFIAEYKNESKHFTFSGGSDSECKKSIIWSMLGSGNHPNKKEVKIKRVL